MNALLVKSWVAFNIKSGKSTQDSFAVGGYQIDN